MKRQNRKPYSDKQEEIALKYYVEKKRGLNYTASKAGCSLTVLNKILKDNNIKKRNYSEAATESNKNRAFFKDKTYFSKQSPNMAWLLGFLAADGNLSKKDNTIKIGLSSVDKEILEKIKLEVQIENNIHDYVNKEGYACSELRWTCCEHHRDLKKYSIVPNKTFSLKPPYLLNKEYWLDYVRGYFDGDGSVNFIESNGKKHYTALRWQVCSATPDILSFIVDVLESYGIPKVNIQKNIREHKTPLYVIQYSTNSTKKIFKVLYSTESNLWLSRKKQHFKKIITKIEENK